MSPEELQSLLERVAAGETTPEDASARLAESPFLDLGVAKLDLQRELRAGHPEAILASGKSDEELVLIVEAAIARLGRVLATRVNEDRGADLERRFGGGYDPRSRLFRLGEPAPTAGDGTDIAVLSAGTSDLGVAEEAAQVAEWHGHSVERFWDVGVAGVHRLLAHLPRVRDARCAIVVAGMDGALPTLVAGLVGLPVIAVPTSVGYGSAFDGLAALLTMLNGCAPGVAVVNIDNGYGAALMASRILRSRNMASP